MNRKIAIVSATEKEIEPLVSYLRKNAEQHSFQTFTLHGLLIDILYSGIGVLHTTYSLMDYLSHRHPDGWIQAGIGGAFDLTLSIGDVFQISQEMISGFGVQERDGKITGPFALGWSDPEGFPFSGGVLPCPYHPSVSLPVATGMTTFYAHGHEGYIAQLRNELHGQIENMEGAAFFYISLIKKIPFLGIRSISNLVEARNKERWNADLAINNLNEVIVQMIEASGYLPEKLFTMQVR